MARISKCPYRVGFLKQVKHVDLWKWKLTFSTCTAHVCENLRNKIIHCMLCNSRFIVAVLRNIETNHSTSLVMKFVFI
jgi:hypothetical protein